MDFENQSSEMVVIDEADEVKQEKKFPFRTADGGIRKKRKKTSAEKNLRLKKQVQPKNAVTCLNELVPGIGYIAEDCPENNAPFAFSVTVNGQMYRGYGSSKTMAKQAAAEAALISFVKPPDVESQGEDTTPWSVLASFAMFRLFNEWREGRIGVCNSSALSGATAKQNSNEAQSQPSPVKVDPEIINSGKTELSNVLSAYLGGKREDAKVPPKPAKEVPENADKVHPVMLLHQLRPQVSYTQSSISRDNQAVFTLTTTIDNKTFSGEGSNLKKAKFNLAVNALWGVFGIKSTYQN